MSSTVTSSAPPPVATPTSLSGHTTHPRGRWKKAVLATVAICASGALVGYLALRV